MTTFDLQGHRGARALAPENTIAGFLLALDLGVTTLELDTVISGDGEVVVSHEPWMSAEICSHPDGRPVTEDEERSLNIFEMPCAEIRRFDCGSRGNPWFPDQVPAPARKPLLREVFEASDEHARATGRPLPRYNVETKSRPDWYDGFCPQPEVFVDRVWGEVEAAGVSDRLTLQSFDPATLRVAKTRSLPLRLSLLVDADGRSIANPVAAVDRGVRLLGFTPNILSPHFRLVRARAMMVWGEMGMEVIPWTVNRSNDMRRMIDAGVSGLITDHPDRAQSVLDSQRGHERT